MSHPKGVLLERAQKLGLSRPEFRTAQTGPEHEPSFITDVVLDGDVIGTGQGGTKRTAEKHAAEEALAALESRPEGAGDGKKGRQAAAKGAPAPKASPAAPAKGGRKASAAQKAGAPAQTTARAEAKPAAAQAPAAGAADAESEEEAFDGPWPMFDDLLAAVTTVAERRVFADLRGEEARVAIRDFSLALYKDLLLGLGDLVDEDEDED